MLAEAEARGASGGELDELEAGWMAKHELVTFDQGLSRSSAYWGKVNSDIVMSVFSFSFFLAVKKELDTIGKGFVWDDYKKAVDGKSNAQARLVAREFLGRDIFWDWDCKFIAVFAA